MLLTLLSTRGLNLWCVDNIYVGLAQGQAAYTLPLGTVDLLNVIYSQVTQASGTDTTTATSVTTDLTDATAVYRIGVKMSALASASGTLTLESSADNITYTTIQTHTKTDWAVDTWYWFNLDPAVSNIYFRASFGTNTTFSEFYLAASVNDLPMTQWNRDTYSVMNNKAQQGSPCTTYYYEKKILQTINTWPTPNNDYDHLTVYRQREVQDVGTLQQTLEIPARWYDPVVWQLCVRIAFESDLVAPEMIGPINQMAESTLLQVEEDESDGAPIYLQPSIRGYTA